jgi:hypothetical protein
MKRTLATLTAAVLLSSGIAFAQQPNTISQRRENQQDRIAQGVRSGRLTPRETEHLERKEARINHQVRRDRAMNDGHLTNGERKQVNREQNHVSRDIYRDKHN